MRDSNPLQTLSTGFYPASNVPRNRNVFRFFRTAFPLILGIDIPSSNIEQKASSIFANLSIRREEKANERKSLSTTR